MRAVPWNLPTGVTFHTPRPGFLAADIQSTMTGIRALSTRRGCLAQMHSAAPACLIERQHRVPLQMRFTVLADFSALR